MSICKNSIVLFYMLLYKMVSNKFATKTRKQISGHTIKLCTALKPVLTFLNHIIVFSSQSFELLFVNYLRSPFNCQKIALFSILFKNYFILLKLTNCTILKIFSKFFKNTITSQRITIRIILIM